MPCISWPSRARKRLSARACRSRRRAIPLALSVAHREGRFKPGDLILMEAIGGGLTWGAATLRW